MSTSLIDKVFRGYIPTNTWDRILSIYLIYRLPFCGSLYTQNIWLFRDQKGLWIGKYRLRSQCSCTKNFMHASLRNEIKHYLNLTGKKNLTQCACTLRDNTISLKANIQKPKLLCHFGNITKFSCKFCAQINFNFIKNIESHIGKRKKGLNYLSIPL